MLSKGGSPRSAECRKSSAAPSSYYMRCSAKRGFVPFWRSRGRGAAPPYTPQAVATMVSVRAALSDRPELARPDTRQGSRETRGCCSWEAVMAVRTWPGPHHLRDLFDVPFDVDRDVVTCFHRDEAHSSAGNASRRDDWRPSPSPSSYLLVRQGSPIVRSSPRSAASAVAKHRKRAAKSSRTASRSRLVRYRDSCAGSS